MGTCVEMGEYQARHSLDRLMISLERIYLENLLLAPV